MATGTVKWFNDVKATDSSLPMTAVKISFAHFSAIKMDGFKTLKEGQKVTYDLKVGEKGKQADNIKPA